MISRFGSSVALAALAALVGGAAPRPAENASAGTVRVSAQPVSVSVQPASLSSGPALLGAAELRALYAEAHREDGVVVSGAHVGARWIKWVKPDGSLELSAAHGLFADTGRFTVKSNEVCSQWEHIDDGKEACVHLVKVGPGKYTSYDADGAPGSTFRVSAP